MESSPNPALEKAATELLTTISSAKGFIVEQAPDIFQQMILWQVVSGAVLATVTLSLALTFAVCAHRISKLPERTFDPPRGLVVGAIASAVIFILFVIPTGIEVYRAVQALFAPKLFLLSEIKNLFH